MRKNLPLNFSKTEIGQLVVSGVSLSFAFSLILFRKEIFTSNSFSDLFKNYEPIFLVYALIAISLAFILHEVGHKYVAQKKGCWAEFRWWPAGLMMAVGLAVMLKGLFVFAAPGAVMISPTKKTKFGYATTILDKEDIGKIGIAGPSVNIVLAAVFGILALVTGMRIMGISAQVNTWLAIFNMLPFAILDGKKVWHWDPKIWVMFMAFSVGLFLLIMYYIPSL